MRNQKGEIVPGIIVVMMAVTMIFSGMAWATTDPADIACTANTKTTTMRRGCGRIKMAEINLPLPRSKTDKYRVKRWPFKLQCLTGSRRLFRLSF